MISLEIRVFLRRSRSRSLSLAAFARQAKQVHCCLNHRTLLNSPHTGHGCFGGRFASLFALALSAPAFTFSGLFSAQRRAYSALRTLLFCCHLRCFSRRLWMSAYGISRKLNRRCKTASTGAALPRLASAIQRWSKSSWCHLGTVVWYWQGESWIIFLLWLGQEEVVGSTDYEPCMVCLWPLCSRL
jgi:hypothetical protein